jgi:hypothetical protein
MDNTLLLAIVITAFFCISKFVESRYLQDNDKPIKEIVRDALVVFVCALSGSFLIFHFKDYIGEFFNTITETKVLSTETTQVFTDAPGF